MHGSIALCAPDEIAGFFDLGVAMVLLRRPLPDLGAHFTLLPTHLSTLHPDTHSLDRSHPSSIGSRKLARNSAASQIDSYEAILLGNCLTLDHGNQTPRHPLYNHPYSTYSRLSVTAFLSSRATSSSPPSQGSIYVAE